MTTGFQVFCSNHPTVLLRAAGHRLADAIARLDPDDLRPLPVLVPSAAVRDRLRDDLAELLGVCAGIELLLPAEFAGRWLPRRLGLAPAGADTESTRWRICAALDGAPLIAPARRDAWDARRLALATRLTDALVRLQQWAPADSVVPWSADRPGRFDDGHPYLRALWPACTAAGDPLETQRALLAAVATATDLPPLVLAIGTPDLSPPVLDLLAALGRRTRVQVVLAQPVPGDWSDQGLVWRGGDEAEAAWSHRLLAHWGVEHRHALRRLDAAGADILSEEPFFVPPDRHDLLAHLQRDLLAGRAPTPGPGRDDSLVIQRACGPRAEAEALKHRLAAWMLADGIAPHQVCIACPDPKVYAPILAAVFACSGEGPVLPVDLRPDAAIGDPALAVAALLMDLLPGRWAASQVLAALGSAPVVEAWNLDSAWQDRVRIWCEDADLRFGTDAAHRVALGLADDATATWRRGLQRLAWSCWLGADTAPVALRQGVAPVADLDEADAVALARLAGLLLPLLDAAGPWREAHAARWWTREVLRLTRHLRGGLRDAADAQLGQRLQRWQEDLARAGAGEALFTADALALILAEPPAAAPARSGGVAVGTPAALRGHPWAIVCCIGMDDGAFPRQVTGGDVDPLVQEPVPGQPDPRHQDRAALLDLLIAAEQHLLISWTGSDPRSGEALPPCPAVNDLLAVVQVATGLPATALIDTIGLGTERGTAPGPWPSAARQDQARAVPRPMRSRLVPDQALPAAARTLITLDELLAALADPPTAYLRRLGLRLDRDDDLPADSERLVLDDHLDNWRLRDGLVAHLRSGRPVAALLERWTAEGRIPAGGWGAAAMAPLVDQAQAMMDGTAELWSASAEDERPLQVVLDDGTAITGRCGRLHPTLGPLRQNPGSDAPRHRQRVWCVGLLWQAAGGTGGGVLLHAKGEARVLAQADASAARQALTALIAWYQACLCSPSPLLPVVADAVVKAFYDLDDTLTAARQAWRPAFTAQVPAPADADAARLLWPAGSDPWTMDAVALEDAVRALGAWSWSSAAIKAAQGPSTPRRKR